MKKLIALKPCLMRPTVFVFESRKAAYQQGFTAQGISKCLKGQQLTHCGLSFQMADDARIKHLVSVGMAMVDVKEEKL